MNTQVNVYLHAFFSLITKGHLVQYLFEETLFFAMYLYEG